MSAVAEQAQVTLEDLGIELPEGFNPDYGDVAEDNGTPSIETDLSALDNDVERPATGEQPNPGQTPPASTAAVPDPNAPAATEVQFDQRQPVADWETRAKANNWEVSTEQEFTDQLELSRYVQDNFFSDPKLTAANQLIQPVAPENADEHMKALLEYDVRSNLKPYEKEEDVENYMSSFFDEDEKLTPNARRRAEWVQSELQTTVSTRVNELATEGRQSVEQAKQYDTELQSAIRSLPADLYTPEQKRELHKYIKSGQFYRDALQQDVNGKPTLQGSALAQKDLENAQFINPTFREVTLKSLHADARKMGADDFVKKYFKS